MISLKTATTTMALSTARGRSRNAGVNGSTARMNSPVIAPAHGLVAPAGWFNDVREKDPPTGNAPDTAAARFATPWLIISRFASQGWRSSAANVRTIDDGSAKPTRAMARAGSSKSAVGDQGKSKLARRNPPSSLPTIAPSYPSPALSAMVTATATRTLGNSRCIRQPPTTMTAVTRANPIADHREADGSPTASAAP